jgi:hypothetical protein
MIPLFCFGTPAPRISTLSIGRRDNSCSPLCDSPEQKLVTDVNRWDEFCMAESGTTINENGVW